MSGLGGPKRAWSSWVSSDQRAALLEAQAEHRRIRSVGSAYHRKDGVWEEVKPRLPTYVDIHSIWADGEGGVWMAGGRLAADPPTDGVLLHHGTPIPTAVED